MVSNESEPEGKLAPATGFARERPADRSARSNDGTQFHKQQHPGRRMARSRSRAGVLGSPRGPGCNTTPLGAIVPGSPRAARPQRGTQRREDDVRKSKFAGRLLSKSTDGVVDSAPRADDFCAIAHRTSELGCADDLRSNSPLEIWRSEMGAPDLPLLESVILSTSSYVHGLQHRLTVPAEARNVFMSPQHAPRISTIK